MIHRESVYTGRSRLMALKGETEAAGEELAHHRGRFARLEGADAAPQAVSSFNLFQTPEDLADEIAEQLGPRRRLLEPSAGLGRLYTAVRKLTNARMTLIDISPQCCDVLRRITRDDTSAEVIEADFLTCDAAMLGGLFDGIIMNPPFANGRDIKHILHAASLLAPGGELVSICAAGPRQREKLRPLVSEWRDLPPGTFKGEGTRVAAAVVTIRKT